jgi:hypothetical protein
MHSTFINAYETFGAKHEMKREAERPSRKDAGTTRSEIHLKEVGYESVDWSLLALDRVRGRSVHI